MEATFRCHSRWCASTRPQMRNCASGNLELPGSMLAHRPGTTTLKAMRVLRCRGFAVLPILDEVVDHGRIGQRRGVAQAARLVLGDLAQDAAHDLAGACLWQA